MNKKDLARGGGRPVADGAKVFDPADESHVAHSAPLMLRKRSCQTIPLPDQDGTTHGAGEIHIRKHADSRLARKCRTFGITSWQRVKELS